jgi:hypothetical protein
MISVVLHIIDGTCQSLIWGMSVTPKKALIQQHIADIKTAARCETCLPGRVAVLCYQLRAAKSLQSSQRYPMKAVEA